MKKRNQYTILVLCLAFVLSLSFISAPWAGADPQVTINEPSAGDILEGGYIYVEIDVDQEANMNYSFINLSAPGGFLREVYNTTNAAGIVKVNFTGLTAVTYTIWAGANDSDGTWIWAGPITVGPNTPPVVSITPNNTLLLAGETVNFDYTTISDTQDTTASDMTFSMDFGDGSTVSTSKVTVPHTYATVGTYTANLTVTDTHSAVTHSLNHEIVVRPQCTPAAGTAEVCVPVSQDYCTTAGNTQGVWCHSTAADTFCDFRDNGITDDTSAMVADGDSPVPGMECDGVDHGTEIASLGSGTCSGAPTGAGAPDYVTQWMLSIKCVEGAAPPTCFDSDDTSGAFAQYVAGGVRIGGGDWTNDTCVSGTNQIIERSCSSGGDLVSTTLNCEPNLCEVNVCVAPAGSVCPATADFREAPPKSRDRVDGIVYYCSLGLTWETAEELGEECVEDHECISNSCVDSICISVTAELQAQRGILQKIWCFLTNMNAFFSDDKTLYCDCLYLDPDTNSLTSEELWDECIL